ncbi:MAG: competence/damage-inducible protein [Clostridia bacterium]|jgi:nicotinamide-nucleotide amidase|uniref:competence/damage-inducible protein A n=1 Tax=Petroclostridium xylanilyticum TaxID=1792311 RepID=UPI000B982993|nr:competence/damage-inducible protein A [Petroclostridium xylanilyticum]MBZ4646256.1 competence/damage-inducible protein [Clostridia bacterium]
MNAEIIAVGTELLLGQILNTNAQFLSVELSNLGIDVYFQTVVGDNQKRLEETLQTALKRADIVILTGGLGPTKDDLTKETIAQVLNLQLKLHQESLDKIKEFFAKMHRVMASNNEKQAFLPEGSIILPNNNGTAPGCIIEKDNNIVIMLPGPPKEMQPMFKEYVYPYLLKKSPYTIYSKVLRIFGIGESSLEEKLIDIFENQSNPTIAPYAKQGEVTLRITAKCESEEVAKGLIAPVEEQIRNRLGIMVYGIEEESLEEVTCKLLMEKNLTLATAESCTGGLLAEKITSTPGISKCFHTGVVTYSNESKVNLLGVSQDTLQQYGAVSCQTALEMAKGIRERSKADIGISITGIAGPGGGTPQKPVGLVYVGMATQQKCWYNELRLVGNRERIRNITVMNALDMLRKYLLTGETK